MYGNVVPKFGKIFNNGLFMENFILFFVENYLIAWVFVPAVIVYKTILFVDLNNEPQVAVENFFYFSHPNVATTHDLMLRKKKEFQNTLSYILLGLIFIQIILAIPNLISR